MSEGGGAPPSSTTQESTSSRPPLQTSVSRSSSFSRAASFRFTPRQSPSSESTPTSPILSPTTTNNNTVGGAVINNNVPPPAPAQGQGQGRLSRHGSLTTRSRPGSVQPSPISSPTNEHKGTW